MGVDEGNLLIVMGVERYMLTSSSYSSVKKKKKVKMKCNNIVSRIEWVPMKGINLLFMGVK